MVGLFFFNAADLSASIIIVQPLPNNCFIAYKNAVITDLLQEIQISFSWVPLQLWIITLSHTQTAEWYFLLPSESTGKYIEHCMEPGSVSAKGLTWITPGM